MTNEERGWVQAASRKLPAKVLAHRLGVPVHAIYSCWRDTRRYLLVSPLPDDLTELIEQWCKKHDAIETRRARPAVSDGRHNGPLSVTAHAKRFNRAEEIRRFKRCHPDVGNVELYRCFPDFNPASIRLILRGQLFIPRSDL